ncbi:prdx3 [Pungitius sinensis]
MSATHPTRLETRTKESNACASQRARCETPWRNESEGRRAPAEVGSRPPAGRAHHRPVSPAASGRWSVSACDRTRKMVNYAWAGRSQRKLWWRPAAVLTCKSVVRPGYRGERLIEPSSSWFPPKFPSG